MKKIFLSLFLILIVVYLGLRVLSLYANAKIEEEYNRYSQLIESDFQSGITRQEAKRIFPKYGASFNGLECDMVTFSKISCPNEFRIALNIPLKGNPIMGSGVASAYLYFDKHDRFQNYELSVDFDRYH